MNITPYAKNAKKHPQKQIDQLAAIVKEVGWRQPILVNQQGVIVAGHGRWETYQQNKDLKEPWVIDDKGQTIMGEAETTPLTKEQEKAYRLADNKLAETDVDMGLVVEELKELEELAPLTGYDMDLLIEPEEADDEVPDMPVEPQSKLGDLYELGEHRVLCGDSTKLEDVERLMDGKKADMVFTDPPYGYSYESNYYKKGNPHGMLENDDVMLDFLPSAIHATENNASFYIFCGWQNAHEWRVYVDQCEELTVKNMIVWKKNNWSMGDLKGAYAGQYELCMFAHKGKVELASGRDRDVWEEDREKATLHPTTKPIGLAVRAMKNHTCNRILDLFLGSGSTLIAAEKTGRVCFGCELDPKYVDVIVQRYVDYTGNGTIKKNGEEIVWQATPEKTPTT